MSRPARRCAPLRLTVTLLAAGGVLAAAPAPPAGQVSLPLDPAASSLTFTIHRPGESIDGTVGRFEGEVNLYPSNLKRGATVVLRVEAVSLQTGNRMRDGKMRKSHLEVDRFPQIVFRSTSIQVAERKALVEGTLALHGVERSLLVPASIRYDNGLLTAEGSVTLTYSDYGIPIPRFLWLVMDDEIVVRFRFVAGPAARRSRSRRREREFMIHVRERHWADEIADEILKQGRGPHEISTGISPSGEIHIGNLREVITADVVFRVLKERGVDVTLDYVADNFDPLRKVYPFLDAAVYTNHIGKPLTEFPCPCAGHPSYAAHFLEPFLASLERLRIRVKVHYADQMYKSGLLVPQIIQALKGRDAIARILHECTGRNIEDEWSPFNPICGTCGRLTETLVTGFSEKEETVDYTCACGGRGTVSMRGGGKLTWRVDWPARWARIPVTIEPFGKDHATRGGSYDTGALICREVFKSPPPFPVTYEWISFKGKGELKKSKGNVLSVHRMLEVLPPEVLRYQIVKTRPMRAIGFDPGLPLLSLIDEFDDAASQGRDPRALQLAGADQFTPVGVPFRHLVNVVQMADFDLDQAVVILKRNNYPVADPAALKERAGYAVRWLKEFAPPEVKFSIERALPPAASGLDDRQRAFLSRLASALRPEMSGEEIHALVYSLAKEVGLEPTTAAFEAIYLAFLGRPKGPRAGWFLAFLEREFVIKRLREAGRAAA